jgi:hypothetical protein
MYFRSFVLAVVLSVALHAAGKKGTVATAKAENEDLTLTVTLHIDPADIKELIGNDLGGHYMVAEVKVEPKFDKDILLDRDDFQLRTDKDGEKAKPYSGSQIAGTGALIIGEVDRNEGVASPGWTGTRVPIVRRGGAARKDSDKDKDADKDKDKDGEKDAAKAEPPADEKENPLKKTLDAKVLPEGKTNQPVQGLLYFPMEKQKMKDLELTYGSKENLIRLRFKPSPK